MAEADLGPSELDVLEDALEELELGGPLDRESSEVDPRVRARLADYRAVLVAARQALPLEDVPTGVLDGVLAQARQAAAAAPVAAAAREPWWTRLRRSFMVPALALAGTAALVLWVFDPADHAKLTEPPAPAAEPSPAAPAAQRAPEAAAAASGERAEATPAAPTMAPADAATADAKAAAPDDDAEEDVATELGADEGHGDAAPAKPAEAAGGRGMTSLGDAPGAPPGGVAGGLPGQAQTKTGGSASAASSRWDIVARGDEARRAGDCIRAREEYALALEDDEPRVRARAFAGLGLCDAAAGDEASADANFERARELDDAVGGFIESQSERTRGAAKKPKPSRKSKAQAAEAFEDAIPRAAD